MNITETTSIADMLAHLNILREANGKKALSSWKNSRVELELRIGQETPPPAPAPKSNVASAFMGALRDVMNGADPDHIADTMKAHGVEPKVTKVEATAPELTKPAKRKAAIDSMVNKAVVTDTPTTVIEVNKAARSLRKEASDATKLSKLGKVTVTAKPKKQEPNPDLRKKEVKAKATKNTAPQGKGEFAKYLESIGMEGRVARAKLRRAKIAPVDGRYPLTDAVKTALASDGRKKA